MSGTRCVRLHEDLVGLLEGTASEELTMHVASCDTCRDGKFDLERLAARLARSGDDVAFGDALGSRLAAIADEARAGGRTSATRLRGPAEVGRVVASGPPGDGTGPRTGRLATERAPSRRGVWLVLAACVGIGASAAVGLALASRKTTPVEVATGAFRGRVARVVRAGADKSGGLDLVTKDGRSPLLEGAEIRAGLALATDGRTRARLELDDGSVLVLDRATTLKVEDAPRTVLLSEGALLADVAYVAAAPSARVRTPNGEVRVLGTKIAVTSANDRTNVEVLRGEVEVVTSAGRTDRVAAGQEGVLSRDGRLDVAPANDLAQRAAFGERLVDARDEDAEPPASGLGELRAKRPGRSDERERAVRLVKHGVKIRIAGNVARTEIDEVFTNDTDDELEGIYRFPLPPGAQIERLALEVDGKLVEGEFVDRSKASAIWRGAIQNAAPKAPKPREEIVWVPGPWHDPALLEWQRGGRFELRIFPIPKRGSRRVVIAYTETVAPASGIRRYVYPLPHGGASKLAIDDFQVDAQVLGHDTRTPVRVRGYELEHALEGAAERMKARIGSFTPSGDLAIEYALEDRGTDMSVWSYAPDEGSSAATDDGASNRKGARDPVGGEPFVALALRPRLPRWMDVKPRDQVIVVDAGRSMFGERFARAKRLAVQMTQEMDRRDRVTVLACDVSCRALPGGFVAPGAPAAHDVDAFLASEVPDGASDLIAAVRAAAQAGGRDMERDLRVVLVSDGVATAGYRSPTRVAAEVTDALGDPRAQVVAVPLGADADVALLGEVARGGGGVVVPYQPGQRLEASALEVLNATYGTTLRDVELLLPDGLEDVAPAVLAPMRAGSETIVSARLRGPSAKGDVVLRGKVGGEPFEARYPIDVKPSTDAGNAFVPRLYAALRIADREREAAESTRSELVALSRRFAVPSRHTSLLVLESEAMFKAFGIDRSAHAPAWTGEVAATGAVVASRAAADSELDPFAADDVLSEKKKDEVQGEGFGPSLGFGEHGAGGGGRAAEASPPAKTMAPPAAAPAAKGSSAPADEAASVESRRPTRQPPWGPVGPRGGRFMKKIFVRRASIVTDAGSPVAADKIAKARADVQASPDERGKHKELARVLALSGQLDELGEALERWSARDPLDQDVILARADLAARRGDRDAALRILGGALAANALRGDDAFVLATTVARSFERADRPEACSFHVAAAELKPTDAGAVARAVACERSAGRTRAAERWLSALKDGRRSSVEAALAKVSRSEPTTGDVVVSARWEGGADLDVSLLDPAGRRAGVVSRLKGARVEGASSRDHETLALATGETGAFIVEIGRARPGESRQISGKLTVRAFGEAREIPFTLTGARKQVGRVDVRWEARLVELDGAQPALASFDRAVAQTSLARVSVNHCAAGAVGGVGHVTVTFLPTGGVSMVVLDGGPFDGTAAGACVRRAFASVRVPPFSGSAVAVGRTFVISARRAVRPVEDDPSLF